MRPFARSQTSRSSLIRRDGVGSRRFTRHPTSRCWIEWMITRRSLRTRAKLTTKPSIKVASRLSRTTAVRQIGRSRKSAAATGSTRATRKIRTATRTTIWPMVTPCSRISCLCCTGRAFQVRTRSREPALSITVVRTKRGACRRSRRKTRSWFRMIRP